MAKFTTKNAFLVPHDTLEEPNFLKLPSSCYIVYITLCKIYNRMEFKNNDRTTHWFYHSLKQLSQKSGLTVKTIIEAKKKLNKLHFIDIEKGRYVNGRITSSDYFRLNGFRMRDKERVKFENYQ